MTTLPKLLFLALGSISITTPALAQAVGVYGACGDDCPDVGVREEYRAPRTEADRPCGSGFTINASGVLVQTSTNATCPASIVFYPLCGRSTAKSGCCIAATDKKQTTRVLYECRCRFFCLAGSKCRVVDTRKEDSETCFVGGACERTRSGGVDCHEEARP